MSNCEKNQDLLNSPHVGGIKMSSSLKERLKRNSRSFSSPVCPNTKPMLKINTDLSDKYESNCQNISTPTPTPCSYSLEDIQKCEDQIKLQQIFFSLKNLVNQKEEKLRKLELVENYHRKTKPEDLLILIKKWRSTSQESIQTLIQKLPENNNDIQCLLSMLNIDESTIQFDPESNAFFD